MAEKTLIIFLSGTRRDLPAFYPAAKAALEGAFPTYEIRMMEDAEPEDIPGDHWSRREATTPDLLIGLVGQYYGSLPGGQDRSLTEQEFDVAGQVGVDRLMFVTEASDVAVVDSQDNIAKARISAFRAKVDIPVTRKSVATPEEFAKEAVKAVRAWERDTLHGATQRSEVFFGPLLTTGALFDHRESFVGQSAALSQLQAFIASHRRVFILHAPWGRGKSRLLLELSRSSDHLRFARIGAPLLRERLRISAADPCVLVVEDASGRETDLAAFLDFLSRCEQEVKLIVTTRSNREQNLQGRLRDARIPTEHVEVLSLPALSDSEQRQLVGQILGTDTESAYHVAVRTRGSTLAAVVAARLIRRGLATFSELEQNSDFVGEVLGRFKDALLQGVGESLDARNRLTKLLQTVALCAPVRPGDEYEADALAGFLQVPREDVVRDLGELERAGLLLRRGGLMTIPVDAIRENEALRACVTPEGELTGFADRALRELGSVFRRSLLRNLALVDWKASQETEGVSLLTKVWPDIAAAYEELPTSVRLTVLKDLEDVAPYQPASALALVKQALASGLGPPETDPFYTGPFQITLPRLYDALTDIVRGTLHDSASFSRGCDLLWKMAKGETRLASSHPRSAERVLQELGELRPHRSLAWYEQVLRWIEQKLTSGAIPGDRLAAYLKPFVAKEIVHWWHDDRATHLRTYRLPLAQVRPLREKAFSLLERIAIASDLGAAAAAIRTLGKGLEPPAGIGGRRVTDEELATWEADELATLERLRRVCEHHRSPTIEVCVLREVAPTANYASQKSVRATAARHAAELHESVAGTIERAILPWWDLGQFNDDEAEQKQEQSIEVAADALLKEGLSEQDLLRRIVAAHENLSAVNYEARPGLLLLLLTRKSPAFAKALMDACLQDDGNPLAPWAEGIFLGLVHVHPEGSKELLERAALEGGPRLKLAVASTYRNIAFESVGSETIFRHLALLLNDSDKSVQRSALQTIWLAKHLDARERAKLLLGFEPASPAPINEWLTAVAPRALYAHFLPAERQTLVAKLQRFARLDFHCFGVLSQLCVDVPGAVVDMLLARVRECATASNDFEPLDEYHGRDYFSELPASDRERGLLFLGELLGSENWRVRVEAQQLFAKLASGDEGARRRVRLSWATSADPELILRAAESFRFEPQQALFTEADTVIAIARAAAALGPDVLEKVTNELVVASLSGVRVSSRGEAAPLDVFIRDEARARANPAGSPEATVYGAIAQSAASSIEASLRRDAEDTLLP